jgi:dienelactone hydrolase
MAAAFVRGACTLIVRRQAYVKDTMNTRQRSILGVGLVLVAATVAVLWLASGRAVTYGPLAAAERWRVDSAQAGTALERVRLTSAAGRRVTCLLRRPAVAVATRAEAAVLLFGGIGTGGRAATLVDPSHRAVVLACDYPWDDPSRLPWWRIAWRMPAIRADVLATPQALAVAASFLVGLPDVDPRRVAGIGASLGVPFVASWAAEDPRVGAVALVYGGGDLRALFEANLRRKVATRWLRRALAAVGATLLADLDPARSAPRIAPRPLLLVGSREDERVPRTSVDALVAAARPPVTTVWFDGGHMVPRDTALLRAISDATVAWLARVQAPLSPSAPATLPR